MDEFTLVVLGLILLALVFVVFPVMMNRGGGQQGNRQINTNLFKARLAELASERDRGDLSDSEFQRLEVELERRLLEDVQDKETSFVLVTQRSWKVPLVLSLSIPLTAWLIYGQIGAQADWEIKSIMKEARLADAAGRDSSEFAHQLTQMLSARLEQKPDDPHYLMLLANTQMNLKNYPAATGAYQRMVDIVPSDPGILGQYAQALYLSSNREMTTKVSEIVKKTLALQADQPTVLGMLGIHNFEQGEYQVAIDYWQRLLPSLGPVSPNSQMIRQGIEQAQSLLDKASGNTISAQESTAKVDTPQATSSASLQVQVSIEKGFSAAANTPVFVFARAVGGPRMPLAVARLTVADLPANITLDDSMAMAPSLKLSSFDQVEVIARISKKGIANASPGDIEGIVGPVTLSTTKAPLTLLINRILP
ncbi:MAG: c-type cytochrome biogenesis protein CcmI [Spongiibacteraceae bacterium]|nr:c-type cytochrome biogenesis protein CcmI [Spongiibacteraceae bacterium]